MSARAYNWEHDAAMIDAPSLRAKIVRTAFVLGASVGLTQSFGVYGVPDYGIAVLIVGLWTAYLRLDIVENRIWQERLDGFKTWF